MTTFPCAWKLQNVNYYISILNYIFLCIYSVEFTIIVYIFENLHLQSSKIVSVLQDRFCKGLQRLSMLWFFKGFTDSCKQLKFLATILATFHQILDSMQRKAGPVVWSLCILAFTSPMGKRSSLGICSMKFKRGGTVLR